MKPRTRIYFAVMAAAVVLAMLVYALQRRELTFEGKTVVQWARQAARQTPGEADPAKSALARMGTNAIPGLQAMLEAKDFPFKIQLAKLLQSQRLVHIRFEFASERHRAAIISFRALGPLANVAIPRLTQLLDRPDTAEDSLHILTDLGDGVIPSLIKATTNSNPVVRRGAIIDLGYRHQSRPEMIRALLSGLKDSDAEVRAMTAWAASRFQDRADVLVPALLEVLDDTDLRVRRMAVQSLGEFGEKARSAIPRLLEIARLGGNLNQAAQALRKIDPDAADKAGIARIRPTPSYE